MVKLKTRIPDLKEFLDEKAQKYESPLFINDDPILIPHQFTNKRDIEVSAFITSIISWGNRKSIINSSRNIIRYMDDSPYDFIINHSKEDLSPINKSIHRTFNMIDLNYFITSLRNIYMNYGTIDLISGPKYSSHSSLFAITRDAALVDIISSGFSTFVKECVVISIN